MLVNEDAVKVASRFGRNTPNLKSGITELELPMLLEKKTLVKGLSPKRLTVFKHSNTPLSIF